MINGSEFIREVYLNARPAIDLDQVTEPIDCRNYTLKISVYERILRKFHVEPGTNEYGACTFVMLNNGPQLVEGGAMEARKRTAIDGRVWWCVWDNEKGIWSTLTCFGKYKTKRGAEIAIKYYEEFLNGE